MPSFLWLGGVQDACTGWNEAGANFADDYVTKNIQTERNGRTEKEAPPTYGHTVGKMSAGDRYTHVFFK